MDSHTRTLLKLMVLKRQRAEQNLLSAQHELRVLQTELRELEQQFDSLNGEGEGIEAQILSYEHRFDRQQTIAIAECKNRLAEREVTYLAAREALKRAFDSEERLRRGG